MPADSASSNGQDGFGWDATLGDEVDLHSKVGGGNGSTNSESAGSRYYFAYCPRMLGETIRRGELHRHPTFGT